jgi:serine/threonine protein kinase
MPVGDQFEMTFDVGTPLYMAPELIRGEAYGLSVDMYAWAFIFWRLITRNKLFSDIPDRSLTGLGDYVVAGGRPKLNDVRDPAQKRLLELCWNQNPSLRPTFREILQDPSKLIICECNVAEFDAYRDEILNAS